MLRSTQYIITSLSGLRANVYNVSGAPVCIQCVRWRRKPRWLPVAKSKMFRVPERKVIPEVERLELMRLHNNYKTQVRAIRTFLHNEVLAERSSSHLNAAHISAEEEALDFEGCMKENEAWNESVRFLREARLKVEAEKRKEEIYQQIDEKEKVAQEMFERTEELVKLEKERSKTFITRETLDLAIETALANPVDYNFSIDLYGNMYRGRDTLPTPETAVSLSDNQNPQQ